MKGTKKLVFLSFSLFICGIYCFQIRPSIVSLLKLSESKSLSEECGSEFLMNSSTWCNMSQVKLLYMGWENLLSIYQVFAMFPWSEPSLWWHDRWVLNWCIQEIIHRNSSVSSSIWTIKLDTIALIFVQICKLFTCSIYMAKPNAIPCVHL